MQVQQNSAMLTNTIASSHFLKQHLRYCYAAPQCCRSGTWHCAARVLVLLAVHCDLRLHQ